MTAPCARSISTQGLLLATLVFEGRCTQLWHIDSWLNLQAELAKTEPALCLVRMKPWTDQCVS